MNAPFAPRRRLLALLAASPLLAAGCASLRDRDPVRVQFAGLDPLRGEGMEMRFALKLRVQNPNDSAIDYDGISLELDVDGQTLASGVSDARGSVPRFGEAVISVPVTLSLLTALKQAMDMDGRSLPDGLPYTLRGKIAGSGFGSWRFSEQGRMNLNGAHSFSRIAP